MEEPSQKLFRLPGTIEEEEEREMEILQERGDNQSGNHLQPRCESPLLSMPQRIPTVPSLPKNITLVRVSTQSSSIGGGMGRQDSARSRYRAGPVRKIRRRAVLKNGECNVLQSRISRRSLRFLQDIFTTLVDTQWRWTLLCFTLSFLLSWLGFAVIWWLIAFTHGDFDEKHLPGVQVENKWTPCIYNVVSFTSCFLFSIETQHTIGYGSRATSEECPEAIFVMCIQSIAGVMIQAFMVGIVFAKMTRPKQRTQTLLFSRNAVICQRDGELCLMFRVGDMRKSHIIGATIRAQIIRSRTTKEGEFLSQHQQELTVGADGNDSDLFFIWPMTIVHRIQAESPLYNMSAENMLTERFEVVVILEGTIESTGQTTQARSSYLPQEILWGHRFEPMVSYSKERQGYEVDYSLFNSTVQVDTPLCSGRELAEFYRVQDDLRHGGGYLVDEDGLLIENYQENNMQGGHIVNTQTGIRAPGHRLVHAESTKSDNSLEDSAIGRSIYRDNSIASQQHNHHHHHQPANPHREPNHHYKNQEGDLDAIEVIDEDDLHQLPDSVNREILKNSREIVYEEDSNNLSRDESFLTMRQFGSKKNLEILEASRPLISGRRHFVRYNPSSDEAEKRSLNGSRRNLSSRNLHSNQEEDKRSLNGSRRNLSGSKRHNQPNFEKAESLHGSTRNLNIGSRENLIGSRFQHGSKELLTTTTTKRNTPVVKASKETRDAKSRRRKDDSAKKEVEIEIEGPVGPKNEPPNLHQVALATYLSSPSEMSPESGIVEGSVVLSSPEAVRRDLKLPASSVIARNRRSYEHAQLQDVNAETTTSRPGSGSSSSDSDSSSKVNTPLVVLPGKTGVTLAKQNVSYTSV
ncbi:uncharacterized protein LOC124298618 isoform X1 [Neodiprion virginianus]|uniref:uncharacterized protein LOC124298618 isoform X1 n=1 Tax=Neodiprion virginianus TaxID=2961670 RepID=UPI001EE76DFC|nr:uncharacterized protein LOC124298618 isoform X1 [Neodiprion virginianus]